MDALPAPASIGDGDKNGHSRRGLIALPPLESSGHRRTELAGQIAALAHGMGRPGHETSLDTTGVGLTAAASAPGELERQPAGDIAVAAVAPDHGHESGTPPDGSPGAAALLARIAPAEARTAEGAGVASSERLPSPRAPEVVEQVVRAARVVVREGITHMEVHLDPPSLGSVRVVAAENGDGLGLTLTAERPETRALLLQAIPDMQAALAGHGVATASIAVATTFEPPTERRPAPRRDQERQARDPRPVTNHPARSAGTVASVDLTV
jgi:hypothetical protein